MGSKLFPFWWLRVPFTCDDVKACLEGDYSSWTEKWVSDALSSLTRVAVGVVDVENDRVFLRDDSGETVILNLTDGSIISEESLSYSTSGRGMAIVSSVLKKYVVFQEAATKFRIYKDGSLQQTVTVAGTLWGGFAISCNGQYVITCDFYSGKIYCYEGS